MFSFLQAAVEAQSDNHALGILELLLQVHALGNNIPDGDNEAMMHRRNTEQPITNRTVFAAFGR